MTALPTTNGWISKMDQTMVLPPNVVLVPVIDGSARLIDLDGRFHTLSSMAAEMLHSVLAYGPDQTAQRIAGRFHVAVDRVRHDLKSFLSELQEAGLLLPLSNLSRRVPRISRVLLPILAAIHRGPFSRQAQAWALLALARIAFRAFGWTRTITAAQCFHQYHPRRPSTDLQPAAIDRAVRQAAASFPVTVECKERAFACWSMARAAGFAARLVVGIETHPLAGHCWCEIGEQIVSDYADHCETFVPIIKYE
jgi:hypothetical protein